MENKTKKYYLATVQIRELEWNKERKSFVVGRSRKQEYVKFDVGECKDEVSKAFKLAQKYCDKFNKKMKRLYMVIKTVEAY